MAAKLYMCSICKLHYENKPDADACHAWCSKHNSCNFAIAQRSVEARKRKSEINGD